MIGSLSLEEGIEQKYPVKVDEGKTQREEDSCLKKKRVF
jgi:hypothetical protein